MFHPEIITSVATMRGYTLEHVGSIIQYAHYNVVYVIKIH